MDRRAFLALCGTSAVLSGCSAAFDDGSDDPRSPGSTEPAPGSVDPLDGAWESYRNDAGNTGGADDPGPADRPVEVWRHTTATGSPATSPAVADGAFVVATASGTLYVRDATDGQVRWSRSVGGDPTAGPVVSGDAAVLAAGGDLVAFDLASGARRRTAAVDGTVTGLARAGGHAVVATESALFAVDADGSERWRRPVDGTVATPPGGGADGVAVGLAGGDLLALEADGSERWHTAVPGDPTFAPTVADGRVLHAAGTDVVALDAATGDRRWDHQTAFPVVTSPAWSPDGTYVGTVDTDVERTTEGTPLPTDTYGLVAALVALAPGGRERWRATERGTYNFTGGPPRTLPLAATADRAFFAPSGSLVAHDAASGERLWSVPSGDVTPAVTGGVVSTGLVGVDVATGAVAWRFSGGRGVSAQPAVVGNTAYVGSDDHAVYALAADAGDVEWTARADAPVRATPAVGDDTVYVGDTDGVLYAFDRADGTERWRATVGGEVHSPALVDDTVFVGNFSPTLHALDAADGSVRWRTEVESERFVALTPAAGDGLVYAGANGDLRAFSTADGTERWRVVPGERPAVQSPPAVADGRVFVNLGDSLRALDAADGTERWSRETGGSNRAPVVRGGRVYAPGDGAVHAFDADGTERWRTAVGRDLALAVGERAVYGVGFETPLTALDPADGSERWRAGADASTGPTLAGSHLFLGGEDGTVRALGPERG